MHKLLLTIFAIAFLVLTGNPAFAQDKISPQKEALIKEFLGLMGGKESVDKMSTLMMRLQQAESEKMVGALIDGDKILTVSEKEELKQSISESTERLMKRIEEFFTKEVNLGQMLEDVALPIYDKHFTETELRELVAFYKTTTGQKSVSLAPSLMMESVALFSEKLGPKLATFLKDATEQEVSRLKQKLEGGKKSKPLPKT